MYSTNGVNFINVPTGSAVASTFATTSTLGTASSYMVTNITGTTFFKAIVKSGLCSLAESNTVKYEIASSATEGIATAASSSVCSGAGTTITLNGFVGDISWQKSINPMALKPTWTTITSTVSATLNTGNLTVPTAFRARVTIGSCAPILSSNMVLVTINCVTDSKQSETPTVLTTPFSVIAYPNPYQENFSLKLTSSNEDKVTILIYDMLGKLVEQKEVKPSAFSELQIGNGFPSGIYNLIVTQGEQTKSVRVIKK
jgi:hypothetical protein